MKFALCLLALVGAGMLAACGGDSGSDSSTESAVTVPKLTKAQFIAKADRLCTQFNSAITPFFKSNNAGADLPDVYEGFIKRLQSLGAPNEPRLRTMIEEGLKIVDEYEAIEEGLIARNRERVARGVSAVEKQKARFASEARDYGLDNCSRGEGFKASVGFPLK